MRIKKNLAFYICPFACNDERKTNVEILSKHLSIFDGEIAVCVATGNGLVESSEVKSYVSEKISKEIHWISISNDPALGEVKGFIPLMNIMAASNPDSATFYCHAKGVTPGKKRSELEAVRMWRDLMYTYCLSDPTRIDAVLQKWPCCGCFKKYGSHHLSTGSPWHFSGTFFWFRNRDIFSKTGWNEVKDDRYWVEGFIGELIPSEDAFCLFGNDPWPCNLYKYDYETWLQFHGIPDYGISYIPKSANESISLGQKRALVRHWKEIEGEDAKNFLLKIEGIREEEIAGWLDLI